MSCRSFKIAQAVAALAAGKVIAYPTEAVWGLGCDPFNHAAVMELLELKQRSPDKGLILVAGHMQQFDFLLDPLSDAQRKRLQASWPGPTTWLVPHCQHVPQWVSGRYDTVALRVSDHPLVRELCNNFGGPLVSTSANPQGLQPARNSLRVRSYFGRHVKIVPGSLGTRKNPSEIRDLASGRIVRPG